MQCLASGSNSRLKLESLVDRTNDNLVGVATPCSLADPYLRLQNLGPKSRWLSKVSEGHSLTEITMHLCFQAGTDKQCYNVLPALIFTLHCFIFPFTYSMKIMCQAPDTNHKQQKLDKALPN